MTVFRHQYGQKGVALILMGVLLFGLLPLNASNAQTDNPHEGIGVIPYEPTPSPHEGIGGGTPSPEADTPGSTPAPSGGGITSGTENLDSNFSDGDLGWLERKIFEVVVGAFGWLALLGGRVMDFGLNTFVREYGSYYNDSFGGAIELVWESVRDLVNLLLIFGLIYIGFRFILDSDDSSAKRNLVMLIIAALLVNFSLFFAKTVVDVSHIAANSFEEILTDGTGDGVSGRFVNVLNLTAVFEMDASNAGDVPIRRGLAWGSIFLIAATLLVAAFVFAAIGVLLAIRFIVISFLLMFSPIMVAGMIFPNLRGLSSSWFNTLLKQSFIAPAIFLTLYASLLILQALQSRIDAGFLSHTSEAVPFYILGMGFIIGSLVIAQKMGGYGASGAMAMGRAGAKKIRLTAQRGAIGGVRMGGRGAARVTAIAGQKGFGSVGNKIANSRSVKNWAKSTGLKQKIGSKVLTTGDTARNRTYDPRHVAGIGKKLGIGEGTKSSYAQRQKNINKKEQRVAKLASTGEDPQIYQDANAGREYFLHQNALRKRDQKMGELSKTNSKDITTRQRLTSEIEELNKHIKAIEDPGKGTIADRPKPATFTGSDADWESELARYQTYSSLRKNNEAMQKNQYAANLNLRGETYWPGFKQAYRLLGRSKEENREAAATIRKEVNKKENDKLIDAIKESGSKSSDS